MKATKAYGSKKKCSVVIVVVIIASFFAYKWEKYTYQQTAINRHYASLEALLNDVNRFSGQLVICRRGVCQDINTHEELGTGQDGYYIVYPADSTISPEIIQHQGQEIKRLTQDSTQS